MRRMLRPLALFGACLMTATLAAVSSVQAVDAASYESSTYSSPLEVKTTAMTASQEEPQTPPSRHDEPSITVRILTGVIIVISLGLIVYDFIFRRRHRKKAQAEFESDPEQTKDPPPSPYES